MVTKTKSKRHPATLFRYCAGCGDALGWDDYPATFSTPMTNYATGETRTVTLAYCSVSCAVQNASRS